ncbi:MAG TPA: AAA family ATPase, partial [Herpetosiphonaceae bacterium]|nr:AAA family ATPase [Herpetosiphonaceae bacterium]
MELPFRLFLQEYSNGIVTAQVLAIPHLSAQATDRATAIESARRMLVSYFEDTPRLAAPPAALVFHEQQELRSLSVDLRPKGTLPPDPIPITVCLIVAVEQHPRGVRSIVMAPRIPGFQLVVEDAEQIEEKTRAALAHHTRKWRSPAILEADQRGAPGLETIHVPVPEPGARNRPGSGLLDDSDDDDESVLRTCGINLTAQVATNGLSRADRRDELVEQILATLAGSTASSVLLVGQEGVGKTALVHEIVARIHVGTVPERLRGRELWAVTGNNLIAGMSYIGQWQGRVQSLIQEVRKGRQILHMGDPNAILDAGRWSSSDNNMGRFLRPYVESGDITIICECTPEGLAAALKAEPGLVHAFRRVDVPATSESETHAILLAEARRLEAAHNLSIAPEATAAVVELTRRFMPYRAFPGKAVSLLRSAIRETLPEPGHAPVPRTLGRADVVAGFARATGLPSLLLSDAELLDEEAVRAYFEERLLGQPDAVMAMAELILLIKAGLNAPNKPLGSFFFVGPTGVGKTEMAKVLASYLFGSEDRLVRFDMSEYGTTDALPKLVGSAWQRENEGELTRRVREQPFCVVLLDELEKAHADVYDALLQVLGEGRLTDASGRTADFRNTIIIMTSNLGASRRETHALGFGATMPEEATDERLRAHFRKEAESFFRPEFFNRIDRILVFRPLTLEAMRRITRRELGKLLMREGITRRNLVVEPFDEAVIETLLERGFHPHYGARPLQREIERMVSLPLARAVLGKLATQHHVLRFSVRQGEIHLSLVPIETPEEALDDGDATTAQRPGKRQPPLTLPSPPP